MKTFEFYCEKFSQIIQAPNYENAIVDFKKQNPDENIICIEDCAFREGQSAQSREGGEKSKTAFQVLHEALDLPDEITVDDVDRLQFCVRVVDVIKAMEKYASLPVSSPASEEGVREEEIEAWIEKEYPTKDLNEGYDGYERDGFEKGIKFLRDKLQGKK